MGRGADRLASDTWRVGAAILVASLVAVHVPLAAASTRAPVCDELEIHVSERIPAAVAARLDEALAAGLFQQVAWTLKERDEPGLARSVEDCLRWIMTEGEVLSSRPLRGGISSTFKVGLPYGVSGVFKWTRSVRGCFRHEIAAYEIDRRLGFDLVPMTVAREVLGRPGSLQFFINDAKPSYQVVGARRSVELIVLDLLIDNEDRHDGNWIFYEFEGAQRLVAIDHNLTFCCRQPSRLRPEIIPRIGPQRGAELLEALRGFEADELESLLRPYVARKRGVERSLEARADLIRHLESITPQRER